MKAEEFYGLVAVVVGLLIELAPLLLLLLGVQGVNFSGYSVSVGQSSIVLQGWQVGGVFIGVGAVMVGLSLFRHRGRSR